MTVQAEDFEIGLSEASFLWLASADYAKRSTVYEALRNTIADLAQKPGGHSSTRGMIWAIQNDKQPGFDVALMPTGGKSIYLFAIMIDGKRGRKAFETQIKRVRDARAELPKLTSFHLNSVKSSTDFSALLDALTNLTDSQVEPLLSSFRNSIVRGPMHHGGLADFREPKAWDEATLKPLSLVWMTSGSARLVEEVFHNTLPTSRSDVAAQPLLGEVAEWEAPEGAPSAAQDADYFFSRRATARVPKLSPGKSPAQSLIQ